MSKNKILGIWFVLIGIGILFIGCVILIMDPANEAAVRQEKEEEIADYYLSIWGEELEKIIGEENNKSYNGSSLHPVQQSTENNWEDTVWYNNISPDYAWGTIDCVLEVPSVKIRRGVYRGALEHDLNLWMVVAARDDYVLGENHYCIYGHNHTTQNLSFNRLKDVKLGEIFTLTHKAGVYKYEVTDILILTREEVRDNYVDNFSLSSDKCYIITCGRGESRYKDLVIEGTRIDKSS